MKKLQKTTAVLLTLALFLCFGGTAPFSAQAAATASPTRAAVTVDGAAVLFQAYNIDGYNYFKLRDIAKALSGTAKQFEVGYDAQENTVTLTTGQAYTSVGGELSGSDSVGSRQTDASSAKVYLDGVLISPGAFLIGGNHYFRLRDLGAAIDFGVTWSEASNTIAIDTSSAYVSDRVGFFDRGYYYTKNPQYHIEYVMLGTSVLYELFSQSLSRWAPRLNCTYDDFSAMGDIDQFLDSLVTFAAEGTDGFLLDADSAIYPRIAELMEELKLPWISCMAEPLDDDGKLLRPYVGYDNTDIGSLMAAWTIDYAKTAWPDADPAELGMISMDFSISAPLHARVTGALSVWEQKFPDLDANFFVADCVTLGLDNDAGYNLTSAIIAANPNIRYWLICASIDAYALGAAQAAEALGVENRCAVVSCGHSIISQWDSGEDSCWKAAVYNAQALYSEPIICGLYAMMNGDASPETLWPEWINHNDGEVYAYMLSPMMVITADNYKEYLEFIDAYSGFDEFDYPYGGTQYPLRETPPASYNS